MIQMSNNEAVEFVMQIQNLNYINSLILSYKK